MIPPFQYPKAESVLRHGPGGYVGYETFRPWLRDEYDFLCVYCRIREQWAPTTSYHIDHFVPQSVDPGHKTVYDNLVYSCPSCNFAKSDLDPPDPRQHLIASSVRVDQEGQIEGRTAEAREIIRCLGLDDPRYVKLRRMMLQIIKMAFGRQSQEQGDLYRILMGFPEDLPDLAKLRPPVNSRPDGLGESAFARRARGELPNVY